MIVHHALPAPAPVEKCSWLCGRCTWHC